MPELPEMENYKKLLWEQIGREPITEVVVNREKAVNVPVEMFSRHVEGKRVVNVARRGKHMLIWLDSGSVLLLHLMLGGWMYLGSQTDAPEDTSQVILSFGVRRLYFLGLRLGYLHWLSLREAEARLNKLGPEALDPGLCTSDFQRLLRGKRGVLKSAIVDQRLIAGIGNCYADEICFAAGILPLRRISDLNDADIHRLYQAMRGTLAEAIAAGGYMENPFYRGDALTGGYNERCRVYDRGGEPCFRCGQAVIKDEHSSRKVFYCQKCQI